MTVNRFARYRYTKYLKLLSFQGPRPNTPWWAAEESINLLLCSLCWLFTGRPWCLAPSPSKEAKVRRC